VTFTFKFDLKNLSGKQLDGLSSLAATKASEAQSKMGDNPFSGAMRELILAIKQEQESRKNPGK
jgi:hypothetical protein